MHYRLESLDPGYTMSVHSTTAHSCYSWVSQAVLTFTLSLVSLL